MGAKDRPRLRPAVGAIAIAAATVGAGPSAAAGERNRPEAGCAAFDLHLVTLLEDHGRAAEMPNEALALAAMTLSDARAACRRGDVGRAFALYERVALRPPELRPLDWAAAR